MNVIKGQILGALSRINDVYGLKYVAPETEFESFVF